MRLESINLIKDLVSTSATIVATIVGVWGVNSWKRQSRAQNDHELARRIVVNLYRYRDSISTVRNPFMWANEMPFPNDKDFNSMTRDDIDFYGKSKAYQARFDKVQEVRSLLYGDLLESQVLWGNQLKEFFNELYKLQNKLLVTVQNYIELVNPKTDAATKSALQKLHKDGFEIMYEIEREGSDSFKNDFDQYLKKIEDYLKARMLT